jgi:hypothetical protein
VHEPFDCVLQRGMERVLNKDELHPEMIATYVDAVLRGKRGKDNINEDDIISICSITLEMLRYVAVGFATCLVHPPPVQASRFCLFSTETGQGRVARILHDVLGSAAAARQVVVHGR